MQFGRIGVFAGPASYFRSAVAVADVGAVQLARKVGDLGQLLRTGFQVA